MQFCQNSWSRVVTFQHFSVLDVWAAVFWSSFETKSKLPTTISSKYFQLLIFERISYIHRTVSYSIWTEKEFNGWNFLQNRQQNYVGEASRNLSTKNIDTLTCSRKKICSAAKQCTYKCFQNTIARVITKILWIWVLQ